MDAAALDTEQVAPADCVAESGPHTVKRGGHTRNSTRQRRGLVAAAACTFSQESPASAIGNYRLQIYRRKPQRLSGWGHKARRNGMELQPARAGRTLPGELGQCFQTKEWDSLVSHSTGEGAVTGIFKWRTMEQRMSE